ncbi:MAG: amidohydrolase family protein, partial [Flavobacteriales bacterium]
HELMEADIPVALATDFNPGSAPSSNMNRVVQLAILKMKMHPLEAIAAATINGAAAMECADRAGVISRGRAANVIVTRPLNGLEDLAYDFGEEPVEKVFIDGIVQ